MRTAAQEGSLFRRLNEILIRDAMLNAIDNRDLTQLDLILTGQSNQYGNMLAVFLYCAACMGDFRVFTSRRCSIWLQHGRSEVRRRMRHVRCLDGIRIVVSQKIMKKTLLFCKAGIVFIWCINPCVFQATPPVSLRQVSVNQSSGWSVILMDCMTCYYI